MSWEPDWVAGGRGRYGRNRLASEDGEEMEESGEVNENISNNNNSGSNGDQPPSQPPQASSSLSSSSSSSSLARHHPLGPPPAHHDPRQSHSFAGDDGDIPGPALSSSGPARSSSFGSTNSNMDINNFRGSFPGRRGGGPSRFGGARDRPRQRGSFSLGHPTLRPGGGPPFGGNRGEGKSSINQNSSSFHRGGGGGNEGPPSMPPPGFRTSSGTGVGGGDNSQPHFREQHGGNRDFRDAVPQSSSRASSGDGPPPYGGPRDFWNEGPLHAPREFGGGDPIDFRGGGGTTSGGEPPFRKEAPCNRDFRVGDRGEPTHRDFRVGGGAPPKGGGDSHFPGGQPGDRGPRDFRPDGPPNRDFRVSDGTIHRDSPFGSGPTLPIRDSSFGGGAPAHRDIPFGKGAPLTIAQRESSFGSGPVTREGLYGPSGAGGSSSREGGPPYDRDVPGGREPSFSDGLPSQRDNLPRDLGPPFRDGPRGDAPFSSRGGEVSYGRGDPPSYVGLGGRDPPNRAGGGNGDVESSLGSRDVFLSRGVGRGDVLLGDSPPDLTERSRSVDGCPSPYGGPNHRETTSGQGSSRGGGPSQFSPGGPPGSRDLVGQAQQLTHKRGVGLGNATQQPSPNSPFLVASSSQTGPVLPGRPTDPRRRASKDAGIPLGTQIHSTPNEGPENSSIHFNDGPTTGPPGQNAVRHLTSYSSLADSVGRPGPSMPGPSLLPAEGSMATGGKNPLNGPVGGGFWSHGAGLRRAISDQGVRIDRVSPSTKPPPKTWSSSNERFQTLAGTSVNSHDHAIPNSVQSSAYIDQQHPSSLQHQGASPIPTHLNHPNASLKRPPHARTGDPRFQRADDHSTEGTKDVATADSLHRDSTTASIIDPFGRTRDWQQKPSATARSATGTSRSSPPISKPLKPFPPSPHAEKQVLVPPKLTSQTSSIWTGAVSAHSLHGNSEPAKSKHEQLPSLLISSLGDDDVVKRATDAVIHFHEVIPDSKATVGGESSIQTSKLPSAAAIMSAVTEIENLARKTEKESEDLVKGIKKAQMQEEERKAIESKKLEMEEIERQTRLNDQKEEQRKEGERMKASSMDEAVIVSKERFLVQKKNMEDDFEVQISKAKLNEKTRCDDDLAAKLSEASATFDKSVAKARRELEKSKTAAQKIDKKVTSAQVSLKSRVETDEKRKKKKKKAPAGEFVRIEDVFFSITLENKRKAMEAQAQSFSMSVGSLGIDPNGLETLAPSEQSTDTRDPKYNKTFEEWSILAMQVTGLSDALYTDPSEAPYYEQNQRNHELIGPSVKEYVRDNQRRLREHWTMLAEEYEVRKRLYEKQQRKLAKKARGSIAITSRKSITGHKESLVQDVVENEPKVLESARSNNPYRRARRGDLTVRSEYEQEQIIAEIAAKEAMEKRITHGGSKLPRQVCPLERELTATYINTFISVRVYDPLKEAEEEALTNVWTDMEKCIFLDRFLQFPKDFRRISSFLRNKSTKDCVAFYYDSKQTVPYKGALKEHMMRRKRKGDYQVFDASIQATTSCGARITAGTDEDKPVFFSIPDSDLTYATRSLHPLKREVLDAMVIDESLAEEYEDGGQSEDAKWKSRKRGRDPLFSLDKEQTKFLRPSSQEAMTSQRSKSTEEEVSEGHTESSRPLDADSLISTPVRKPPQKWTAIEKKVFLETLEQHGRDWAMLSRAVGTKSISQIKNYYYDYKKQSGKYGIKSEKNSVKLENNAPKGKSTELTQQEDDDETDDVEDDCPRHHDAMPPLFPKLDSKKMKPNDQASQHLVAPGPPGRGLSRNMETVVEIAQDEQGVGSTRRAASETFSSDAESRIDGASSAVEDVFVGGVGLAGKGRASQHGLPERLLTGSTTLNGGSDNELLQQLLNQQAQQHHSQHLDLQFRQHQHQQQGQQQPQSALQQLLSRQHQQREQQQQQSSHRSLEEARRLLQQQAQSHHQQQVISNLFPPWSTGSQLLQAQTRMQQAQLAAAMQQEGSSLGNSVSDLAEVANLQHLLQMQQSPLLGAGQTNHGHLGSLLGLSTSTGTGLSAGLLAQLEGLGTGNPKQADQSADNHSVLNHGGQSLLRFGNQLGGSLVPGSNLGSTSVGGRSGNPLFQQGSGRGGSSGSHPEGTPSVSDAFALLTRAMQRDNANNLGFGAGDRHESDRFG